MTRRSMGFVAAVAAMLSFSFLALAQSAPKSAGTANATVPRTADGKVDLSGFWTTPTGAGEAESIAKIYGHPLVLGRSREPWLMTPWAKAQYDYNQDPTQGVNAHGARLELNPRYAHCIPLSLLAQVAGTDVLSPFEIHQSPRKLTVIFEHDNAIRQIFTDGRPHPKPLEITWLGHSTGNWEGDTLVVDTVGMRDETWLDNDGHVHSDHLRMIERIQRVDHDTLRTDITLEDAKALEQPWHQTVFHKLRPNWDLMEDVRCTENIKRGVYTGSYEN